MLQLTILHIKRVVSSNSGNRTIFYFSIIQGSWPPAPDAGEKKKFTKKFHSLISDLLDNW